MSVHNPFYLHLFALCWQSKGCEGRLSGSDSPSILVREEDYMRRYELIFILRSNLGEEEITKVIDYSQKIITDEGGSVIELNRWGMKKLAYPIKKELQGYYVFCDYAGTPAAVSEIERRFRIDDAVLKYLTIKIADSMTAEEVAAAISTVKEHNEAARKAAEEEAAATAETETAAPQEEEAADAEEQPQDAPAEENAE